MIRANDLEHCRAAIKTGSLSFHAASRLLPASVRDPSLALYAFCRLADDEVDEGSNKAAAVLRLQDRLDRVYEGTPIDAPEDRAFAAVVEMSEMPRALPDALLEGLAWDADERRYQTLSDVRSYSARVASAVGAMMCVLMGARDADVLARACDLGVAMQLTNIARDIGEDARAGRIYLPLSWLVDAEIDTDAFLENPVASPEVRKMTRSLLGEADRLYRRSEAGINCLPLRARVGIWAARLIYDGIGKQIRTQGYDTITRRAHTTKIQKLGWLAQAAGAAAGSVAMPKSALVFAPPLDEVAFLVEAGARNSEPPGRAKAVLDILSDLRARELEAGRRPTSV